jgi:hypothetical protein
MAELGHQNFVLTWKSVVIGLVMLVWATASHHCDLEQASGWAFLRCASDPHESGDGCDHSKDVGCCSIEYAQYHAPRQLELTPIVGPIIFPPDNFDVVEQSLPKDVSLGILTAAPPELPTSWQFLYRTALPVRAPSLAS